MQLLLIAAGGGILPVKGEAWKAISTGLITAGVAGLIAFFYVVLQEGRVQRQRSLEESGLRDIFARRSVSIRPEYDQRLQDAHKQIDILGFGLNSLREDFLDSFATWAQRCKVRVLLLDPEAPTGAASFADRRDSEEGATPGKIRQEVEQFLAATTALRSSNPNFEVRLYHALPSVNIFRIDDSMFFGPYLLLQPSRNTPTLLIGRGTVFDRLEEHYNALWSDGFSRPAT